MPGRIRCTAPPGVHVAHQQRRPIAQLGMVEQGAHLAMARAVSERQVRRNHVEPALASLELCGHGHAPFSGQTGRRLRKRMVLNRTWSVLIRNMMEV